MRVRTSASSTHLARARPTTWAGRSAPTAGVGSRSRELLGRVPWSVCSAVGFGGRAISASRSCGSCRSPGGSCDRSYHPGVGARRGPPSWRAGRSPGTSRRAPRPGRAGGAGRTPRRAPGSDVTGPGDCESRPLRRRGTGRRRRDGRSHQRTGGRARASGDVPSRPGGPAHLAAHPGSRVQPLCLHPSAARQPPATPSPDRVPRSARAGAGRGEQSAGRLHPPCSKHAPCLASRRPSTRVRR